jgi:hypothetical protein
MQAEYERLIAVAGAEDMVGKVVGGKVGLRDSLWER